MATKTTKTPAPKSTKATKATKAAPVVKAQSPKEFSKAERNAAAKAKFDRMAIWTAWRLAGIKVFTITGYDKAQNRWILVNDGDKTDTRLVATADLMDAAWEFVAVVPPPMPPLTDEAALAAVAKGGKRISKGIVIVDASAEKPEILPGQTKVLPFQKTPTAKAAKAAKAGLDLSVKITAVKAGAENPFKAGSRNALRLEEIYTVGLTLAACMEKKDSAGNGIKEVDIRWNLRRGDLTLAK